MLWNNKRDNNNSAKGIDEWQSGNVCHLERDSNARTKTQNIIVKVKALKMQQMYFNFEFQWKFGVVLVEHINNIANIRNNQ